MRRLLLAFITFLLASAVVMPAPVGALPSNVVGTPGGAGELVVTWDQSGDVTVVDYLVEIDQGAGVIDSNVVPVAGPLTTTFTGLTNGATYDISVTARDGGGLTVGTPAPGSGSAGIAAPSGASISLGSVTSSSMVATFSADDGGGSNTYTLTVRTGSASGPIVQGPDPATSPATISGLSANTEYFVTVVATNAAGSDSATASATTSPPPVVAPSGASVSLDQVTSSSMRATFSANDGGGSNTYTLTVRTGSASGPIVQGPDPATSPATISGLSANTEYFVTVVATNAAGSDSATASATTAFGSAGAPTGVSAALTGTNNEDVRVTWTAPANTGGGLGSYTIRLSNGQTLTAPSTATSVTFTSVAAGSTVTATVQSSNGAGSPGASSGNSNSVTTSNVPGPVTGLSAAWAGADNINSIDVSWNAPASDGGLAISGYGVTVSPALANPIPDVAANATSLTIGGLEQGTTYTITVVAKNARGSSSSASSGGVLVPTTPGTVTNLVVQQSPPFSSTVVLTWELPTETGGAPISGFSVVVDDREPLVVGPDVTTARFTGLPVGDHNVTVRAITAAGLGATVTSPNFEVKAFPPFDSEEAFVTQIYADFLGRAPDAAGLAFWTARVADDGSNVQDIIEAFMRSPEFAPRRAVARLYFAYFNHQPDKGGFDFWTRQISSGAANLENASQSFAQSPEFQRTYGSLTDAEFVVLVYNNVLGRRPDQGGFLFWLDRLDDGLPRGTLMTQFSESPENIARSRAAVDVTVTYDGMLQRAPEVAGFLFWTGRVSQTNEGLTQLIREFYFSPEYAQRVND